MPKFSQDASKSCPNPPKIDPKAIQQASWSPSWTFVLKIYDLERPTNSQNTPKSGPKTLQSVPNPSQMEPKTLPNQIFEQFLRLFFSGRKFASFFCSFVAEFVCFCKSRPLKFMRPRSVCWLPHVLACFEKSIKNHRKTFRNLPKIEEKSKKNRETWKEINGKSQDEWGKPKNELQIRKNAKKVPTWVNSRLQNQKVSIPRRDGEPPLSTP